MKPRSAPLAAVEDLDRDHEGGYAVPRDTVTPGTKVKNLDHEGGYAVPRDTVTPGTKVKNLEHGRVYSTKRHCYTGYQGKESVPGQGIQYQETLLHRVPR